MAPTVVRAVLCRRFGEFHVSAVGLFSDCLVEVIVVAEVVFAGGCLGLLHEFLFKQVLCRIVIAVLMFKQIDLVRWSLVGAGALRWRRIRPRSVGRSAQWSRCIGCSSRCGGGMTPSPR